MKKITWGFKLAAVIVIMAGSTGCKTYMHFKYGLTQPRVETPGKIAAFVKKYKFPAENQHIFSDSACYGQAIRNPLFSKYLLSNMIFNREGLLLQRDTAQCQWSGYDMVKSLRSDSAYATCNDLQLEQVLTLIQPLGKDMVCDNLTGNPDFTVIVTWAKFIGTYNARLFVLSEAVTQNATARIRLVWLNVDMQESWKLNSGQKVAIR